MVKVIHQPQHIIERITTQTVQGEVTINLNLTITVNHDGSVQVAANPQPVPHHKLNTDDIPESVFTIPTFEQAEILDGFGEDAGR